MIKFLDCYQVLIKFDQVWSSLIKFTRNLIVIKKLDFFFSSVYKHSACFLSCALYSPSLKLKTRLNLHPIIEAEVIAEATSTSDCFLSCVSIAHHCTSRHNWYCKHSACFLSHVFYSPSLKLQTQLKLQAPLIASCLLLLIVHHWSRRRSCNYKHSACFLSCACFSPSLIQRSWDAAVTTRTSDCSLSCAFYSPSLMLKTLLHVKLQRLTPLIAFCPVLFIAHHCICMETQPDL